MKRHKRRKEEKEEMDGQIKSKIGNRKTCSVVCRVSVFYVNVWVRRIEVKLLLWALYE